MPVRCSVISCKNNNVKCAERFFSFPKPRKNSLHENKVLMLKRSAKWLKACGCLPKANMRICGKHFVKGEPADLETTDDIDWVPTLFLPDNVTTVASGNTEIQTDYAGNLPTGHVPSAAAEIASTHIEYSEVMISMEFPAEHGDEGFEGDSFVENSSKIITSPDYQSVPTLPLNLEELNPSMSSADDNIVRLLDCWEFEDTCNDSGILECLQNDASDDNITKQTFTEDKCTQTNTSWIQDAQRHEKKYRKLSKENNHLQHSVQSLQSKLSAAEDSTRYSVECLEKEDKKCAYITGIASGRVLRLIYEAIKNNLPKAASTEQQERLFVLALRKIRLNEPFYTLGLTYNLHHSTVADKVFQVIHCMYPFFSGLVKWPSRDTLKKHMPSAFREKYGDRVTIILDCFEISIESPKSDEMIANANVYSFYKHHKTVKILAGITPAGCYAFISETFGGRISDKQITSMSGILDNIQDGDFVMADRGFLIGDVLAQKNAVLSVPAFKKANKQLQPLDACNSKDLSALRIHVERLIGSLRQKVLMLADIIPISTLQRWNNGTPALDQIVKIAAGIVNLCPSIVRQ